MPNTMVQPLNSLLADYQVFYQKLRNYHWNVYGPQFFKLHEKFEEMYDEAADQIDEIAERILALGARPASTFKEYLELASLKEDVTIPAPDAMVENILADLKKLIAALRGVADKAAGANDPATANLVEEIADGHEKTAWMLTAWLAK